MCGSGGVPVGAGAHAESSIGVGAPAESDTGAGGAGEAPTSGPALAAAAGNACTSSEKAIEINAAIAGCASISVPNLRPKK